MYDRNAPLIVAVTATINWWECGVISYATLYEFLRGARACRQCTEACSSDAVVLFTIYMYFNRMIIFLDICVSLYIGHTGASVCAKK